MSRSELERLVAEGELRSEQRQRLQGCHSRAELAHLARSLGYGITTGDVQRAKASEKSSEALGKRKLEEN